ncbi:hypothetical protein CMV_021905 [Castanea mollissima]|uniref:Uncharacterized protein n=1 Tax=Castanea mollissima TaxID=60419 RepID=A0A8J4QJA0_9ROSI|nr:hypothetical protein CMV_021905 [Castanea mollissima]
MGRSMPPKPFSYLPDPRLNWEEKLLLQLEVAGQIPIEFCHVDFHLNPSPNGLQAENEERKAQPEDKSSRHSSLLLSREPPPPHRSLEQKEFLLCPLLPPLGLCCPLLAQTSTTPHTEAHRHKGRRSCAWSLETYRSRREPRSKGAVPTSLLTVVIEFSAVNFSLWDIAGSRATDICKFGRHKPSIFKF